MCRRHTLRHTSATYVVATAAQSLEHARPETPVRVRQVLRATALALLPTASCAFATTRPCIRVLCTSRAQGCCTCCEQPGRITLVCTSTSSAARALCSSALTSLQQVRQKGNVRGAAWCLGWARSAHLWGLARLISSDRCFVNHWHATGPSCLRSIKTTQPARQ